jgi:predicted acetyltransferase
MSFWDDIEAQRAEQSALDQQKQITADLRNLWQNAEMPTLQFDDGRKYGNLQNQGVLGQQLDDIRRKASRSGIFNSGFLNSLQNPAYRNFGFNTAFTEGQIGKAKTQAEQNWERMKLMGEASAIEGLMDPTLAIAMMNLQRQYNEPSTWEQMLGVGTLGMGTAAGLGWQPLATT